MDLGLTLEIHLTKHVQGRLLPGATGAGSCLVFNCAYKLPSTLITLETIRLAILWTRGRQYVVLVSSARNLEVLHGLRR